MNLIKNLRSEKLIPFVLFLIILINYIPIFRVNFVADSLSDGYSVTSKVMAICFVIELFLIVFFLFGRVKLKKNLVINFIILIVTTAILLLVQVKNYFSGNFQLYDLFNIACIFVNINVLFIAFTNLKTEEKYMSYFFVGILAIGLVACIVNVYLYKDYIITMITTAKQISIRSFFAHRNQFSMFLFTAIVSNIMLILKSNKKSIKVLLFIPLIIFGLSLITTSSRTGIAATALFIVLFFITTNSIKIRYKILIVCGLIAILIATFVIAQNYYPDIMSKITDFVDNVLIRENTIKSFTGRDKFWKTAEEILQEDSINMFFGVGRFQALNMLQYNVTHFHNFYVEALMTGGIMELVFFLFIHIYTVVRIMKSEIDKKYKMLYLSMFLSLAVYGLFETMGRFSLGYVDTLYLIFFITIPLLHTNTYKKKYG